MVEQGDGIVIVDVGCHTDKHGTVHGVHAVSELSDGSLRLVTHKFLGTLLVGKLEFFQSEGSALLIVCTGDLVIVRDGRGIDGVQGISVGVDEFDTAGHELVNVAEVEEILFEVVVFGVKERNLVVGTQPVEDRVEELWLVRVKSEIIFAHGGDGSDLGVVTVCSEVFAILDVHRSWAVVVGITAVGGSCAGNTGFQLWLIVKGSIGAVSESEGVVVVGTVGLDKVVGCSLLDTESRVGSTTVSAFSAEFEVSQFTGELVSGYFENTFFSIGSVNTASTARLVINDGLCCDSEKKGKD
mmetsp:Transcript_17520/g.40385  ORF Transcript_17520/g.40385 Transcript_17520/m.40385 type:complete len:298 (+) Transcript_17520:559-1452(+)